ncbi:MAG: trigger factor [Alphaproteobacteria bacterium]
MQVSELTNEGLKREYKVVVPADELGGKLTAKIDEIKGQIKLPGFRPGKVPAKVVRSRFGTALLGDLVQEALQEGTRKAFEDNDLRPAMQPKVDMASDMAQVEGGEDLVFTIEAEIMPDVPDADFPTVKLEKEVAEISDDDMMERLEEMAKNQKNFEDKDEGSAAENGDAVVMDFVGSVDGVEFDGGAAEGHQLELGSGQFIPGFEEQLIGLKAGDEKDVEVTFPAEYGSADLAGKDAVFKVKIHNVKAVAPVEINDAFAVGFGLNDLDDLKTKLREQMEQELGEATREKLKRALLDALDDVYDFDVPPGLLESEFNQIWGQFEHEMEHLKKTFDEMDQTEEEYRAEYNKIAARRVRLGLVLAEIGRKNEIEASQDELTQAIMQQTRQFPGQEQAVFEFYSKNPEALAQMRAPIIENKVVDFILELANVTEKKVTKEELYTFPDEEQLPGIVGHTHDDDDHDHDH